jgi:glycosyltransferase involved in cell wall biosynthesis
LTRIPELLKHINADLVYCFKPMPSSFGIGLLAKRFKAFPLLLDIEDWDFPAWLTNFERRSKAYILYSIITSLPSPQSAVYGFLLEPLVKHADAITVVSSFLQGRFGGFRLVHGANTDFFDPAKYEQNVLREKYGVPHTDKIIFFGGTPRPHKGLDDLVEAIDLLGYANLRLMIVGGHPADPYVAGLKLKAGERIRHIGYQPHYLMPELLAVADMVALPQRFNVVAKAQIPGKIFEAMAMAKPLVVTRMSDLPEIVEGCGLVVDPGNLAQLAQAIESLLADKNRGLELGNRARQRCQELYSWNAMEVILEDIFRQVC